MAIAGYARVSSIGQLLDVQVDKLKAFGCDEMFQEKRSGVTADRPALKQCRKYIRKGDVLAITKLDRLARSTFHLTQIANELKEQGAELVILNQNIDTSSPTGKLFFNVLASTAEFEGVDQFYRYIAIIRLPASSDRSRITESDATSIKVRCSFHRSMPQFPPRVSVSAKSSLSQQFRVI